MDKKSLLKLSYRYLSFRQRSEGEIIKYLSKKTTNNELIQEAVKTLKEQGFINDDEFIKEYINSYLKKGLGPSKIRFNLLNKGIDKNESIKILDSISEEQWLQSATIIIKKKDYQLKKLSKLKLKQKIYNLLTYRGHNYKTIKSIIDAYPHLE